VAGVGLIKDGPGTLILSGANTYGPAGAYGFYTTATTVNAGELRVNSGTGGSLVLVNPSGRLSGTGTIVPTQGITARNTVTVNGSFNLQNPSTLTVLLNGDANTFNPSLTYSFTVVTATTGIPSPYNIFANQAQFDTSGLANYVPGTLTFQFDSVGNTGYL